MAFWAMQFGQKLASDEEADAFESFLNSKVNRSTVCDTAKLSTAMPVAGAGFYCRMMTVASFSHLQDPRPKLQHSRIPVLIMKGQCDNVAWGFTSEYLQLFPAHRLVVIPDAGHGISQEQPERYIETIKAFLKE